MISGVEKKVWGEGRKGRKDGERGVLSKSVLDRGRLHSSDTSGCSPYLMGVSIRPPLLPVARGRRSEGRSQKKISISLTETGGKKERIE